MMSKAEEIAETNKNFLETKKINRHRCNSISSTRISCSHSSNLYSLEIIIFLKYCIRGMLGDELNKTVILFMDAITALCAPSQDTAKIEHLKEQVNVALARLEGVSTGKVTMHACLKTIVSWVLFLQETLLFLGVTLTAG